jgi:hypothetical protein
VIVDGGATVVVGAPFTLLGMAGCCATTGMREASKSTIVERKDMIASAYTGCGKQDNKTFMGLYTKNGRPLQVSNDKVYSRSGIIVGRINGDKVYGTDGRYVGTIVGDRLVYRSTQSSVIKGVFSASNRAGAGTSKRAGSGVWGDEPNIPD